MRPLIYTFASDRAKCQDMLDSCQKWGWPVALHLDEFPGDYRFWHRFFSMIPRYRDQGYTHLVRLDAFDVKAVGPPSKLAEALEAHGNPAVLISAEFNTWPMNYRANDYPPKEHPWWYAHSPLTVDLTQPIPPRFLEMPDRGYGSDQMHFADLVLDETPGVAIDRDCRVVQSMCGTPLSVFKITSGRVYNLVTGTFPLFMHNNGGGCVPAWIP